ncbi:hypothetical protein DL771_000302 [Monosporascus sp. 5C6A]|nr:hypothetical protein DL771_000302 [Monosporascus sp. 5C6A]
MYHLTRAEDVPVTFYSEAVRSVLFAPQNFFDQAQEDDLRNRRWILPGAEGHELVVEGFGITLPTCKAVIRLSLEDDPSKSADEQDEKCEMRIVRLGGIVQNAPKAKPRSSCWRSLSSLNEVEGSLFMERSLAAGNFISAKGYFAALFFVQSGPTYSSFVGSFSAQQSFGASFQRRYTDVQDLGKLQATEATYSEKITNYESADQSRTTSLDATTIIAAEYLSTGWVVFAGRTLFMTGERHGGEKRGAVPLLGNEQLHRVGSAGGRGERLDSAFLGLRCGRAGVMCRVGSELVMVPEQLAASTEASQLKGPAWRARRPGYSGLADTAAFQCFDRWMV